MKYIIVALAALSIPCMAAEETVHNLVKNDAKVSGVQVVWGLDVDFELTKAEVAQANTVPKGMTSQLAATVFKLIADRDLLEGLDSEKLPGVFSCSDAKVVLITNKAWVSDACKPVVI